MAETKTFKEWLDGVLPKITAAQEMLAKQLAPDVTSEQATDTEDAYREACDWLSEANSWLADIEYRELMAMDRDHGTASERKIILNFKLKDVRMLRDKLKGLSEALKSRMRRSQWIS